MGYRLRRLLLASVFAGTVTVAGVVAAQAATSPDVGFSPEQISAVKSIGSYFNAIHNIKGDFTQVGPQGNVSTGVFYISKPGRMRFEYAAPNPFLVVSDGTWVTIKNRARNIADQYPLSATPLRLVLANQIDLMSEANIKSVDIQNGLTTVVLEDKDGLVPGQLILVYDNKRKQLQSWVIVDGQGRRTTISLDNIEAANHPDPKLFAVSLPAHKAKTNR